ncbi:MAG: UdgX family uracil-DNA binding protein [Sphingomonadaceae bacterium]|uniref:UdgX family uracil-DNA binding protein n=1 Tax=Thermaurantiacus sp. TaxID=2820283 RepID=UPI00298ED12A|nr:UdgX family uracil-DNA binding protein [Thermaurantiacus sp.]MCS6986213.1 UdgX family uracil-DNA binding protein [Sphingomonadaceae bacterium]MDW8415870.1 UdgX family uracil-DNA binding protein [Thermaurantiacus sp.]
MERVVLAHPADLDGFRQAVRRLVARRIPPAAVQWEVEGEAGLPLGEPVPPAEAPALRVPRRFADLAEKVVCHADPSRFVLLHEALVRVQNERHLLDDRADPLVDRLEAMAKAVGRDLHKMRAFVRFRELEDDDGPHFIAFFEPAHHILRANAGFFVRRFASQRWTILTPRESAHWDGQVLHFGPGAARGEVPSEDALEPLWTTYFRAIFNPARLKPAAMRAEMPKKYWANLPEAAHIPALVAGAPARVARMLEAGRAATLARLAETARDCTLCPLHEAATQTVFGEGPADARLMLVGEQPGDQEDLQGRPFVGPAGQLLDRALRAAGIDRPQVYITNAVKHFKFMAIGKRRLHQSPDAREIETCRWWLEQELELVRPAVVVMLGASAGRALLGRAVVVARERGRPLSLSGGRRGLLTVHPSYLLRIEPGPRAETEYARFVRDLELARRLTEAA